MQVRDKYKPRPPVETIHLDEDEPNLQFTPSPDSEHKRINLSSSKRASSKSSVTSPTKKQSPPRQITSPSSIKNSKFSESPKKPATPSKSPASPKKSVKANALFFRIAAPSPKHGHLAQNIEKRAEAKDKAKEDLMLDEIEREKYLEDLSSTTNKSPPSVTNGKMAQQRSRNAININLNEDPSSHHSNESILAHGNSPKSAHKVLKGDYNPPSPITNHFSKSSILCDLPSTPSPPRSPHSSSHYGSSPLPPPKPFSANAFSSSKSNSPKANKADSSPPHPSLKFVFYFPSPSPLLSLSPSLSSPLLHQLIPFRDED